MATPHDISKWAQIVALKLEEGKDREEIIAYLDKHGAELGTTMQVEALNSGQRAYDFAKAMNAGDMDRANALLREMEAYGAESVVIMGRVTFLRPGVDPEKAEEGDFFVRRLKRTLSIHLAAEQIESEAEHYAEAMATGAGNDTPGANKPQGIDWEFGAPL